MRNPWIHVLREHILESLILRIELTKVVSKATHGLLHMRRHMTKGARQLHHGIHESHARTP